MFGRNAIASAVLAFGMAIGNYPLSSPAHAFDPTTIAKTGLSIRQVTEGLEEFVKSLEQSASRLIEQGNNAIAQQQMLAAGILRSLIRQVRDAFKESLDQTFDKVAARHADLAADLEKVLATTKGLESKIAKDVSDTIYRMQGAANQLIDRLPLASREPILYGMIVHDVFSELPKKGFDLELLGFHFVDPTLNKRPRFSIEGEYFPDGNISVQNDRVHLVMTESLKKKVGYSNDYCAPRPRFALHSEVYYNRPRGIWPVQRDAENVLKNTNFALADPELFTADIRYSATRSYTMSKKEHFQVRLQQTNVGCEDTASGNLSYRAPHNAQQINCRATWAEAQRLKAHTETCSVGGSTVTATGSITGRDRNCWASDVLSFGLFRRVIGRRTVCDCRGGGQGIFELSGDYFIPEPKTEEIKDESLGRFRFDDRVDVVWPTDSSTQLKSIEVAIRRNQCDRTFDTIHLRAPAERTLASKQSSANGHFTMDLRLEKLVIEKKE